MANLIAPATLEQIRAANDIVDVIGSCFPLKRAGANFLALCPFHKEKSPSFNVNPHRQIFHCFGCHKGGDVFTFIREYENLTFIEAVRRLADRANIQLETEHQPGQGQARHLKEQLLEIHEKITFRWQSALLEAGGQGARQYLAQRGIAEEAVKRFRLGYAPEAWDDSVNWSKAKGYDLALVEQAGLILRKENSDHYYDRFRGRLIFPICDEQGRVIGFSGRLLGPDAKAAKYLNSPETAIFHKSKVFFGLDKSKRAILDADNAIICEGQLDLIACFQAGIENVVAPQGTAFTQDHARLLKRYVNELILCFDSDSAGQTATVRAWDSLFAAGLAVRIASLPSPHDPDSFIKEFGPEAFRQRIEQAEGFFEFYLNRLCSHNDPSTDKGRLAILKEMAETVHKTGNQVLIDTYAQKTALRLGVAPEAVRVEFKKQAGFRPRPVAMVSAETSPETEPPAARPSPAEFWLLKILFLREDLVEWTHRHLDLAWLKHPQTRNVISARLQAEADHTWRGVAAFLQEFDDPGTRGLITEASLEMRSIPDPEKALKGEASRKGVVEMLRNDFVDRQLAALQQQAGRADLTESDMTAIESQKISLRQMKQAPLACVAACEGQS
jgi:DNA primase